MYYSFFYLLIMPCNYSKQDRSTCLQFPSINCLQSSRSWLQFNLLLLSTAVFTPTDLLSLPVVVCLPSYCGTLHKICYLLSLYVVRFTNARINRYDGSFIPSTTVCLSLFFPPVLQLKLLSKSIKTHHKLNGFLFILYFLNLRE